MIILRQKEFGWFSFGKKQTQEAPNYKCPSFSDLPSNLQQSLKGVERAWKKPETQKLLKQLKEMIGAKEIPFTPFVDQKSVEAIHKDLSYFFQLSYPEDTLIYPLIRDDGRYYGGSETGLGGILCYVIGEGKFLHVGLEDGDIETIDHIRVLNDFIKKDLDSIEFDFPDDIDDNLLNEKFAEFKNLIKKIKKAFWIS